MSRQEAKDAERSELLRKFADNINNLREQKEGKQKPRYSQEDLAHDRRLHRTEIGRIERAEVEPRLLTLMILADGMGLTLNDLVRGLPVPKERKPPPGARLDQ